MRNRGSDHGSTFACVRECHIHVKLLLFSNIPLTAAHWARPLVLPSLWPQFFLFSYKFKSHLLCKTSTCPHVFPLFDLKLSSTDVHRTLKLQGVNPSSTREEREELSEQE